MKRILTLFALTLGFAMASAHAAYAPAPGPGGYTIQSNASGGSGIEVKTVNGETTIRYNGETVWSGKTEGPVRAQAANINGEAYAAAYEGDKLLWENREGAGEKVKGGSGGGGPPNLPGLNPPKDFKKFQ